jgi:hypothetical protein
MNTISTRTRRGAAILFSGILVLGGLALTGKASAGQVVEGNPTCPVGYEFAEKQENPSGTYTFDRAGVTATITVGTSYDQVGVAEPNKNNAITSYSVPGTEYRIIVKGGNGAIIYSPGETPPLHAPPVGAHQKWPTISHFQLCWNTPAPQPEVGQLTVEKAVVGTDTPDEYTFEICVTPVEAEGAAVCKEVVGNGTLTFDNLPPGEYVVTETDPGPRFSVEGSGVTVTVESQDMTGTTVTNTWIPPNEEFGQIEVTKVVTGAGAPIDSKFEICVERLAPLDPVATRQCQMVTTAAPVTFGDLVPGTYKVTETNPGSSYTVKITPNKVEVPGGEIAKATVTNTYKAPPTPPPEEEVVPPTQEALPPTAPMTPTAPTAPAAPATPAAPTAPAQVSAQVPAQALPTTGSEGGLAAIAAILMTTGVGLTLLGKRRGTQQA